MDALNPLYSLLTDSQSILILAAMLGLGYALRINDGFPNKYIGWTVTLFSFYAALLYRSESVQTKVLLGFIYAAASSLIYEQGIKFVQNWIANKFPTQGNNNGENK